MAWSGKISPDSRIWGSMVMMASWMACPWVSDTVEMSTPMPTVTNRNSTAPRAKTSGDPAKGTLNSSTPTATITARSTTATPR